MKRSLASLALAALLIAPAYAQQNNSPPPQPTSIIIGENGSAASVTGTLTETQLGSCSLQQGYMSANGHLEILTLWNYTNSSNNKVLRVKFGGTAYSSTTVTTTGGLILTTFVFAVGTTNSQSGLNLGGSSAGTASSSTTSAVDTSVAATTISMTGTLANSGETITLVNYTCKLFP